MAYCQLLVIGSTINHTAHLQYSFRCTIRRTARCRAHNIHIIFIAPRPNFMWLIPMKSRIFYWTLFQAHLALDAAFFINRGIPKSIFIFYHRDTVFWAALLTAFTSHTALFYLRYVLHFIPLNFFSDTPSPLLYALSTAHQLLRNQSSFH